MQTDTAHRSHRRRRSQSVSVKIKDTPALRLAKVLAIGFVAVIAMVIFAAKYLVPGERQGRYMSAEQERACTRAYLAADTKLMASLCDPDNWRQGGDAAGSSQASLP